MRTVKGEKVDKLACMRAFTAVANAGGFSRAARKSNLTKALLSKYVAQLEESLNIRLFNRTTRQVSLTEVGRAYYTRCIPLLEELDELEAVVQDIHTTPSGELNISAPTSFSELHLMQVISSFTSKYPDIRINMVLTDRVIDIVEEGFDLALRIGILPDSSLIACKLSTIRTVACASPEYLQQYGEPDCPKDLLRHSCIIDTNYKSEIAWSFERDGDVQSVNIEGRHYINSAVAVRKLALAHNGIALCPTFVLGEAVKARKLKIVLSKYKIEEFGLYAVYSHRRHLSTKVQLFMALLKEYFSEHPAWEE